MSEEKNKEAGPPGGNDAEALPEVDHNKVQIGQQIAI